MKFPQVLYVKIENNDDEPYFIADKEAVSLVEMGEKIRIARYTLDYEAVAEGVAKITD